ncbi:MAG: hypothetical protein R6X29_03945 [Acidimicrobiia bacterium]
MSAGVGILVGILILVAVAIVIALWMRLPGLYQRPVHPEEGPPNPRASDLHTVVEEAGAKGAPNPARR